LGKFKPVPDRFVPRSRIQGCASVISLGYASLSVENALKSPLLLEREG